MSYEHALRITENKPHSNRFSYTVFLSIVITIGYIPVKTYKTGYKKDLETNSKSYIIIQNRLIHVIFSYSRMLRKLINQESRQRTQL